MDCQGETVFQVHLGSKENLLKKASRVSVDQMASQVLLDHQVRGVHLASQASVGQVNPEKRALQEDQAFLELLDYLVPKVSREKVPVHQDLKVSLGHGENLVYLDFKVTEDFKETLGHQVFLDKRVNQEPLELDFQVQVVLKESMESQELQESQENQESQVVRACQDSQVHLV